MNESKKDLLRAMGFLKEVENIEKGLCAFCGSDRIKPEDFDNDFSRHEHSLSGLCQACQNSTFADGNEYID